MSSIVTVLLNGKRVEMAENNGVYYATFTAESSIIEVEHMGCIGDTKVSDILFEKGTSPTLQPTPIGFSVGNSDGAEYMGITITNSPDDPTNPLAYNWTLIRGQDGATGVPGPKGTDGRTPYLHIAYANSTDGRTGFSVTDSVNKLYIGQYTDYVQADSTDPSRYKWTLTKGDKGDTGARGATGPIGPQGLTTHLFIAYADSSDGSVGFSTTNALNKLYLGTYSSTNATQSTNFRDYKWQRTSDGYNQEITESYHQSQEYIQNIQGEVQKLQQAQEALAAASAVSELQQIIESLRKTMATDKKNSESNLASALSKVATIENSLGDMAERWKFLDTEMQMSNEGFLIGNKSKGTYLLQKDDRISFFNNGSEVAFISGGMLQITQAVFVENIQISEYMIGSYANDPEILIIRRVGKLTHGN